MLCLNVSNYSKSNNPFAWNLLVQNISVASAVTDEVHSISVSSHPDNRGRMIMNVDTYLHYSSYLHLICSLYLPVDRNETWLHHSCVYFLVFQVLEDWQLPLGSDLRHLDIQMMLHVFDKLFFLLAFNWHAGCFMLCFQCHFTFYHQKTGCLQWDWLMLSSVQWSNAIWTVKLAVIVWLSSHTGALRLMYRKLCLVESFTPHLHEI